MAQGAAERAHNVEVSVMMNSPSFVSGSRVSAVITIRCERSGIPASASSTAIPSTAPANLRTSAQTKALRTSSPGSAQLHGLGTDEYALLDYVVCEVAGRWTTDRAWVAADAHNASAPGILDLHAQPPLAAQVASRSPRLAPTSSLSSTSTMLAGTGNDTPRARHAWDAALDDANKVGGGGRLGYAGIIFRSQTLVVCEREQVPLGSQTSFAVQCVLPDSIPPTLRGAAVRYSYALIVVVALPGSRAPKAVRVPFRVVCARSAAADGTSLLIPVPTPADAGPIANRFLEKHRTRALSMSARLLKSTPPDDIEVALALSLNGRLTPYAADDELWRSPDSLDDDSLAFVRDAPPSAPSSSDINSAGTGVEGDDSAKSSRRSSFRRNAVPVYAITRGKDSIARMYLPRRRLLLGDNISAVFYFHSDKPCLQLGARLEVHEIVKPKYGLGTKQHSASENGTMFRKVYGEHGEFVMMNRNTHVTFSIPYDAPASFSTDVVEVRWLIHFVFLISRQSRRLHASPLNATTSRTLAQSTVLDDDEASRLLDQLKIEHEDSYEDEVPGWEGGAWAGEDPSTWKQIPRGEVDVLRWTLPLHVQGEPNSQWGTRNHGSIRLETIGK